MTLLADDIGVAGPTGKARRWTDEEKALLALLLLSDTSLALALWRTLAPTAYRGLLEAVPIDNVRERAAGETLPPIWFDLYTQHYGLGSRGFIREAALVGVLEAVRRNAEARAEAEIRRVYAGDRDIREWQHDTAEELRTLALMIAMFGAGGSARVDTGILAAAGRALEFPITRLVRFARQAERGIVLIDEAARRAVMYPDTVIKEIYHESRRIAHELVGFNEEINVLNVAEHCTPGGGRVGCPDETAKGWVPIGTLVPIGDRRCLFNCRCGIHYRRA